ncbi:MAG: hypothetical protein JXX28_13130 [Deltaproteobacteria bacterium]|nr:hypothetical protein [Deltaproteobacteria bacterium]
MTGGALSVVLFAATSAVGALLWVVLTAPDQFLALWTRDAISEEHWFGGNPPWVLPLSLALGLLFVGFAFATGFVLTFAAWVQVR